jgi:hypothetical protein
MNKLCDHIESLDWNEAVAQVRASPARDTFASPIPALCELIESGAPLFEGATFLKIEYPYGDLIVNSGHFRAPKYSRECKQCQQLEDHYSKLGTVPLQLVLQNNLEIFLICEDLVFPEKSKDGIPGYRTVPVDTRRPGDLIGLFENLRPLVGRPSHYGSFFVSSGSRHVRITLPVLHNSVLLKTVLCSNIANYQHADIAEYRINSPHKADWDGVASEWHLIKESRGGADWSASVLLFPSVLYGRDTLASAGAAEWRSKFLLHLLCEAWGQSQGAIETFVPDDHSALPETLPRYVLSIDDASISMVLRHLNAAVNGQSLVWRPANGKENGPFADFLRWAIEQNDEEQVKKGYLPLILEPGRLSRDSAWGIFSLAHPIIAASMRFKRRVDSHGDLAGPLQKALFELNLQQFVHIAERRRDDTIDGDTSERVTAWFDKMGVPIPSGRKLSRNRLLRDYLTLAFRENNAAPPARSRVSGMR